MRVIVFSGYGASLGMICSLCLLSASAIRQYGEIVFCIIVICKDTDVFIFIIVVELFLLFLSFVKNFGKSTAGGGSTLTQQVVKNVTKDDDTTGIDGVIRKLKEWVKAYQIEEVMEKDEILADNLLPDSVQ